MNDLITLYAPELLAASTGLAVLLLGANILQAITAIVRKSDMAALDDILEAVRQQAVDERAKREQAATLNETLIADVEQWKSEYIKAENEKNKWQKVAKEVEADRDEMRIRMHKSDKLLDQMRTERATLYRRNAKGQIEPITPKERKPHTLKHGMTVKDTTPAEVKRIFAEARKAGIVAVEERDIYHRKSRLIAYTAGDLLRPENKIYHSFMTNSRTTYISAREFLRRIKGEIV
jgi:hypothetical protein